jgi:hypothetical protein
VTNDVVAIFTILDNIKTSNTENIEGLLKTFIVFQSLIKFETNNVENILFEQVFYLYFILLLFFIKK